MNRRVLVCDDHPVVRDAIADCVRAIVPDGTVETCGTAGEAVQRLAGPGHWDLLVLDLVLPDARGVEALIRVRERAPSVRVAVLSAWDDRRTVERAMRAGADRFVSKTADRASLVASLRPLLGLPPQDPAARHPPGDDWIHEAIASMTPRQMQVLRLLVGGRSNRELCEELGLAENTVKVHISSVLRVLRCRNRTEAVGLAGRVGFGA
ncbi:MAG TPA: response regulator transcription factor [Burkholderiaceae bacterium]|nr:response regulator transcription factor [Burkholderiaceae bacterium]